MYVCLLFYVVSSATTNLPLVAVEVSTPTETRVLESENLSFSSVARAVNILTSIVDSQLGSLYKNLYRCGPMLIGMS